MKTKIKTIMAVLALGIIGFTNIHATADNNKAFSAEFVVETEDALTVESWMINDEYWNAKTTEDTLEIEKPLEVESWMTNESLWN